MKKYLSSSLLNRGFTLVELMIVIAIIGILATTTVYTVGPYLGRARDTTRYGHISEYTRILGVYYDRYFTLPQNGGRSGDVNNKGYCADEVFFKRSDMMSGSGYQFSALKNLTLTPLRDPLTNRPEIIPCDQTGSYLYVNVSNLGQNERVILGARMEGIANANYLTGSDISTSGVVSNANFAVMNNNFKGTFKKGNPNSLYYFMGKEF